MRTCLIFTFEFLLFTCLSQHMRHIEIADLLDRPAYIVLEKVIQVDAKTGVVEINRAGKTIPVMIYKQKKAGT